MTTVAYSVKSYLSAIGAVAIYVSVNDHVPKSIGVCRDLDRALADARAHAPVSFGWVAWSQPYEALLAIAKTPDLMLRRRSDGARVIRSLPEIVQAITEIAERSAIVLTPHRTTIERATELALSVERAFEELRISGQLASFNAAYKRYRKAAEANGEKAMPYWKAQEHLRKVTIKTLARNAGRSVSQQKLGELISQEFPWFRSFVLDSARECA